MDSGTGTKEIVAPSAGVHVILPNYFSPTNMGLLDPSTSDGRVIFFLPWQGGVIAGTTDSPTTVDPNPIPSDNDINWILKEVAGYLSPDIKVRRGDVQAAWSGIRPLVRDPAAKNTAALVRTHMINVSESGLLTIAGGKWTTYRAMAEETIDKAIQVFDLKPLGPSLTLHTPLLGSMNWSKSMFIKLIQHFGLETEVAKHLSDSYGDRAWAVAAVASNTGSRWPIYGTRIASGYPYIEAEIRYACQNEFACTAVDAIARRTRLSFLNAAACLESLPRIIEIMAGELGWDSGRQAKEMKDASDFLLTMGLSIKERLLFPPREEVSTTGETRFLKRTFFTSAEIGDYKMIFTSLNLQNKPDTPAAQLQKAFGRLGTMMSDEEIESIKKHMLEAGSVDFPQFLEILANVKDMRAQDKFARKVAGYKEREQFPTERSGGGV